MSQNIDTAKQFDAVIERCHSLFSKKLEDYGAAWRILRLPSLTDQIFIKAQRIRSIQQCQTRMVDESEASEFVAIVNYCIIALIQIEKGVVERPDMENTEIEALYEKYAKQSKELMMRKNHDYGEAWREMRISSLCDIILQKLLRVKQIEDNGGLTKVSEGIDANYYDMVNYSIFALIKLMENNEW
ncbi:MAG: DUF1599 domain-containing protein [Flavobacteriales bacterium]|nr:DUF1599 domain-containing protein [Flavobacteriales bacterium]